jgi:hypothetical protein
LSLFNFESIALWFYFLRPIVSVRKKWISFLCLDFSIPHKIKQALVLLIKLLIVGAAFYFIYNQLANSDPRLGGSSLFYSRRIGRFSIIFILLWVSWIFLEILKWQNLVFFLHPQGEATKQVLCCLWTIYSNGIGNTQVKPCSLINQLPKKCCFKLDLQWTKFWPWFWVLVCCILMQNSI